VQGLLELAGIPYVGSGVLGSAVGMDKALMKATFEQAGLPVCRWFLVREKDFRDRPEAVAAEAERLGYPLFVKPANLGSSVGITKVRAPEGLAAALAEAFRYDRRAVVEEGLTARELECGVLGNDEPEASVVGEVIPSHEFYDYEAKYVAGSRVEIPARIPPEVASEVRRLAVQAFLAIDAAGLARVDFFYTHDGRVLVNEINTMPGFTPYSMYPKMWEATGLSYAELLARLVELGLERHRQKSAKEARRSP
jgi:D-alanine-D-alanine ligase